MNSLVAKLLKMGASGLAIAAAAALMPAAAQAAPCGTIDPAEAYNPGSMTAEILCENGSFDEARNLTPGGFGRSLIRVTNATISGGVINDFDSVLDSTGNSFFVPLNISDSSVAGLVQNDGLLRNFNPDNAVVEIFRSSIGGFLNNQFIYGDGNTVTAVEFADSLSAGDVVNNGTVDAAVGFSFNGVLIQGALKQTSLATINGQSGDAFNLFNTIVEGGIDLDGVGTAGANFLTITSGLSQSPLCGVIEEEGALDSISSLAVLDDVCNGSIVQGDVVIRGDFQAGGNGIQLGEDGFQGLVSTVNGNIIVSGRMVAENENGVSINSDGVLNGKVIIQAGGQLISEFANGIFVDGVANGIDVFGRVQGGRTGIDTSRSDTAVPINLYTGAVIVGTNAFSEPAFDFQGPTVLAKGPATLVSNPVTSFSTAINSRNGISETHTAFGGLIEGNVFGDYGGVVDGLPTDIFVVKTVGQGAVTNASHLRTANTFNWLPGDGAFRRRVIIGDGELNVFAGLPASNILWPSFSLNSLVIENGAAIFGSPGVTPYSGPDFSQILSTLPTLPDSIFDWGFIGMPTGFGGSGNQALALAAQARNMPIIQVKDFTVAAGALAYFTDDVRLKVSDSNTFTLAPGATWVIGAGIVDTIQANRNAGGAIAALTVPTPNDKCDYFAVNCPYYNAAGFNVQIARVLAQSGQVNNANLVIATDSVRFINQARVAPRTFVYDDVVQDLNNVGDFLNGRFATFSTIAPVFITATGRYRNLNEVEVAAGAYDNFDIELTPITYEQAATSFNKRSVGWALDNFAQCYVNFGLCPPGFSNQFISGVTLRSEWVTILENISELTSAADYARFGWAVQGDEYAQTSQIGLNLLDSWTQGVNNRLRNALYSQNGVQWADKGGVQVASLGGAGLSGLGASGTALGAAKGGSEGVAFWGRGVGQWADEDGDAEASGYEADTLGFQFGTDWTSSSGHWLLGASVLWSQTDVEFDQANLEQADIDSLQGGLYATYGFGNWYWNAQASIGRNDVEQNRVINFDLPLFLGGTFSQQAQLWSGYTQTGWTLGTEIGAVWNGGDWNIQPFLGLKYRDLTVEDIVERSRGTGPTAIPGGNPLTPPASAFQLTVVDGDAESLQSELGARFTTNWDFSGTTIRPEIEVSWLHEFLDTRQSVLANFNNALVVGAGVPILNLFAASSPNFQIVSSDIGEDAGQIKMGFNAVLDDNWELYAGYRGLFTDGYQDHGATITVKANW